MAPTIPLEGGRGRWDVPARYHPGVRARWTSVLLLLLLATLLLGWTLRRDRRTEAPAPLDASRPDTRVEDPFLQGRRALGVRGSLREREAEPASQASDPGRDSTRTRRVRGMVVTDAGAPVRRLLVWTGAGPATRTDEDGRFDVRASRGRDYLAFHAPRGFVSSEDAWPTLARTQDWVEIVLVQARSIQVRLVDAEDRPVGGARVHAERPEDDAYGTTDADGRVVLEGLQPGVQYEIYVRARHAMLPDTRFAPLEPTPDEKTLRMPEACWIEGVVVDREGRPVGDVVLETGPGIEPIRVVSAEGSGRFRLGPVGAGRTTVRYSSSGGEYAEGTMLVEAPSTDARLRLAPLVLLELSIEIPDGESLTQGAWVADGRSWRIHPGADRPHVYLRLPDVPGTLYVQASNGRYACFPDTHLAEIPRTILLVEGDEISGVLVHDDLARIVFDTMGISIEGEIDLLADIDEPPFRIRGVPPRAEGELRVVTGPSRHEETIHRQPARPGEHDLRLEIPIPPDD